ncbi:hypothetical protein [Streptodolium elevatio]
MALGGVVDGVPDAGAVVRPAAVVVVAVGVAGGVADAFGAGLPVDVAAGSPEPASVGDVAAGDEEPDAPAADTGFVPSSDPATASPATTATTTVNATAAATPTLRARRFPPPPLPDPP